MKTGQIICDPDCGGTCIHKRYIEVVLFERLRACINVAGARFSHTDGTVTGARGESRAV